MIALQKSAVFEETGSLDDRLAAPIGSYGVAKAVIVVMPVEIPQDDVVGCGGEIAPATEALSPVSLANMFELLLDFAR